MLRGAHKQMIVVRTRDSRLFEEAHFVMRRGVEEQSGDDWDLVFEANRIIENSLPKPPKRPGAFPPPLVSPAAGQSLTEPYSKEHPRQAVSCRSGRRAAGFNLIAGLVWFFGGFLTGGGLVALLWWIL